MTKLEELKAAYEAATKGEWKSKPELTGYTGIRSGKDYIAQLFVGIADGKADFARLNADASFIALAHNLMPTLLEAVVVMQDLCCYTEDTALRAKVETVLEKLK